MTDRLRQAELASLVSSVVVILLTTLTVGRGAVELNPLMGWLLSAQGEVAVAVARLGVVGLLFATHQAVRRRGYPRVALVWGGMTAVGFTANAVHDIWVVSKIGLPETMVWGEFAGYAVMVVLAVVTVWMRSAVVRSLVRFRDADIRPSGRAVRAIAVSVLVVMVLVAGVWPFVGPFSVATEASAASPVLFDDFEDADLSEWSSSGTDFVLDSNSSNAFEGDYSMRHKVSGFTSTSRSVPSDTYNSLSIRLRWSSFHTANQRPRTQWQGGGNQVIKFGAYPNQTFAYNSGGSWIASDIPLNAKEYYTIRAKNINYSSNTYDIEILNKTGNNTVGTVSSVSFVTGASTIDKFQIAADEGVWNIDFLGANGIEPSFSPDLAVSVKDQSGSPVNNATVKVLEYKTSNQNEIARLTKKITDPEPPEFDANLALTGSGSVTDVDDGTYAIAHTADDWEMSGWELGGGTAVLQDATLRSPTVTLPANEPIVLSLWDASEEAFFEDTVDEDLPGRTTDGKVVLERVDSAGDTDWDQVHKTESIARVTAVENGGTKTHEGVAIESGLSPGFYRVYPEGGPERAYTFAVAPNSNVDQLTSSIREGAQNQRDNLINEAQELQDCIDNGNCAVSNATTNETGYAEIWSFPSSVTETSVIAYKGPPGMTQDTPTPGEITTYYESQLTDIVETDDGEITCHSGADVGSFYTSAGMEQVDVPDRNVTLQVKKVGVPEDLEIDKKLCLEQELLAELLNSSLADFAPFIRQRLGDLSTEEISRLLAQIRNGALMNERVCKDALRSLGVSETSECGLSESEIDDDWIGPPNEGIYIGDGDDLTREEIERIIRGGGPILGGGGGGGGNVGGGGGSVSPGDVENTVSGTFPFDLDLSDSVVTVRAHLTNGTTQTYNTSSEYVSVETRSVRSDVVRVENLPIGDVAGAELAVDVVTPNDQGHDSEPFTNPGFSGTLPALRAISLSAIQPGPDERVTVGVDGEPGGKFGALQSVEVIGPVGQFVNTTNVSDGEASFTTNGSGRYKVRLTFTNAGGQEFVEVVGLIAGEKGRARPPTLRGETSPIGMFAVVSDGLDSGDIETAAAETQVRVAAIISADAEVPPAIHVHTQAIDTAADYTTTVRVLRAPDDQAIRKRTTVIHHGASVPSNAIMYRQQEQPLPRNGTNEYGRTHYQGNQSVVESYTDAGGSLSVRRITEPSLLDSIVYNVRLQSPSWVPVTVSVPDLGGVTSAVGLLLLDLGGVLLLVLRRRRGLPSTRTVGVLLVAGMLVTVPQAPILATGTPELSPTDDGLLRSAEDLPENVQRYGTEGVPGWVVKIDTSDSTNATDALQDWANASSQRSLIDGPTDAGYAVVSAPRGDVGATLVTRTLNRGLAHASYVEHVEPEMTMEVPDPSPLDTNASWSPTLSQQIVEWTTRGDNFGVDGVAWREDVNESTMQEGRQATRSDTVTGNGTGIMVAPIDTGINTQSGQVFGNGTAGSDLRIDNASKNFLTGESVNATAGNYSAIEDGNGHGTWVASAIGSAADEPYRGYAPDSTLLVLKALGDDGSGSTHTIAEAIRYAAAQDADVISLSLGSVTYSAEVAEAVQNATEQGSVVVVAAGNSRQTIRWVASPADTPTEGVLTVGAASVNTSNTTDVASTLPAHFSQMGPDPGSGDLSAGVTTGQGVDLVAPGMKVSAATPTTSGTRTNTTLSGTSMATPMVAGAIAQVLDDRPRWQDNPERVAGYARNTTRMMPNASVSAAGHGYLAVDQLAAAQEHDETQAEARTDAARARDAGWKTLSDGTGGFLARLASTMTPTAVASTQTAAGVA